MRQIICGMLDLLDNPRYLAFDGTKWKLDEDTWNQDCCDLGNAEVNGIRAFSWSVWGARPYGIKSQFAPFILQSDKFNLLTFNSYYFPIVKRMMSIAKDYGLTFWYVILDNCQFHGDYKKWSPFVTNVNNISTIYDPHAYDYIKSLTDICLEEFREYEPAYCFANEANVDKYKDLFVNCYYPYINMRKINPYWSTYGATMEDRPWVYNEAEGNWWYPGNAGVLDDIKQYVGDKLGDKIKLSIWKEVHGIGRVEPDAPPPHRYHQASTWWMRIKNNGIRVWLEDDGTHPRPTSTRWARIVTAARGFGNDITFAHCPEEPWADTINILKTIYRTTFLKDPVKKYTYTKPIPPTPPQPPPVTPPPIEPEKKPWWHWWFGSNSLIAKALRWLKKIF